MEMESVGSRKVTILGALLFAAMIFFATLATGCYDNGGWGGGPGYYGNSGYYGPYYGGYYGGNYYGNRYYRGWDHDHDHDWGRGAFGGWAPGHEAWEASSRGRTSFGGAGHGGFGGGHGGGGHR